MTIHVEIDHVEIGRKRSFHTSYGMLAATLLLSLSLSNAQAQMAPQMGYAGAGAIATAHMQPYSTEGGFMNAHGDSIVQPACYGAPCGPGGGCGPAGMGYGPGGGYGGMDPFGGYGANVEQCGPHYFDFSAEYLSYERRDTPVGSTIFSTFGVPTDPTDLLNREALSTSDIDSGNLDGFRLTGRLDVGALSVLEVSYSGLYDEGNSATAVQQGPAANQTLFSIFSDYGRVIPGAPAADADFEETANAARHTISYDSDLQSVEASFRRYWVGFNPRVSGTLLAGFRYTRLKESFSFFSDASTNNDAGGGTINIGSRTDNELAGAQMGGDVWVTLLQGLRVGGEAKVGIYSNEFEISTSSVASDGTPNSITALKDSQVAFLGEAKVSVIADLTPNLSARAGYEVLYINELALVGDNLFVNPPYGGTATPINEDGESTWHGWHAGLEFTY